MTLRDCECSFLLAFFMLKKNKFPCFANSCDLAAILFASLSEKRWQKCLLFVILISQLSWFVVHGIVLSNMSAAT